MLDVRRVYFASDWSNDAPFTIPHEWDFRSEEIEKMELCLAIFYQKFAANGQKVYSGQEDGVLIRKCTSSAIALW